MNLSQLVLVAAGGAAGAVLRLIVTVLLPAGRLPWGTLLVNVLGGCAIGWCMARLGAVTEANLRWHSLLVVGFCGGFTTFSTFSWQLLEQVRAGQALLALIHVVLAVTACLAATWCGWRLGRL